MRPSARSSRVQVWFGLYLRLGWEASRIYGLAELSPSLFVVTLLFTLVDTSPFGLLDTSSPRNKYDCILRPSPSLWGVLWGVSFVEARTMLDMMPLHPITSKTYI